MPQADPFRHVYTGVDQTCKRAVGEDVVVRLRQLDLTHSPSLALARDIYFSYCTRDGVRGHCLPEESGYRRGYDPLCSPQDRAAPRYPYRALHREAYRALCRCRAHIRLCFPLLSSDDPVRAFSQYRTALDYYNRRLKSCPVCWGSKSRSPPIPRGIRGRPQPGTITFRCRSSVREWDMLRKNHADLPGLARKLRYRPGEPEPDSILIRVRSLYKR